jgi:hypothetical protein
LNFLIHFGIAAAIIAAGGFVSGVAAFDPAATPLTRGAFGIAAILAQLELFAAALYLRSKSVARFDMTVAAETLVALGVFSLIGGIVLAALSTPKLNITAGSIKLDDFTPLLISFGEGLLASATAPLAATFLRQYEVLKYAPHSESGTSGEPLEHLRREADTVAKALSQLRIETEKATNHTASFASSAKSILDGLNELAADIKRAKDVVPTALSSISREIGNAGPGVTAAFNTAADNVRAGTGRLSEAFGTAAGNISTEGGRVSDALSATGFSLGNLTAKVASSAESVRKMTDEFNRLGRDADAATGILTELQKLIDRVTNFLRPDKS